MPQVPPTIPQGSAAPHPSLPPETLRRLAAFRRLLSLPEFRDEFLPGLEAECRESLSNLGENAPEQELRKAFIRWKYSMSIGPDIEQFVKDNESLMEPQKGRPAANTA